MADPRAVILHNIYVVPLSYRAARIRLQIGTRMLSKSDSELL